MNGQVGNWPFLLFDITNPVALKVNTGVNEVVKAQHLTFFFYL